MAISSTLIIAGTIFAGLGAAAAIYFWDKVIEFAHDVIFPFFEEHLPQYEDTVRTAFKHLNNVAMNVRKAVIQAWEEVRDYILKVVETWERTSDNEYVLKVTSWLHDKLSEDEVTKTTSRETVSIDDLPEDVMEAFLENNTRREDIDVTEQRDREVKQYKKELSTAT